MGGVESPPSPKVSCMSAFLWAIPLAFFVQVLVSMCMGGAYLIFGACWVVLLLSSVELGFFC